MPELIFFKFYLGDYTKDTKGPSMLEHGAYFMLLTAYYSDEGPLPDEPERLNRICAATSPEEIKAVSYIINRFFPLKNGDRRNKRADDEIKKARKFSEIQRKKALSRGNAGAMPGQCPEDASHVHVHVHSSDTDSESDSESDSKQKKKGQRIARKRATNGDGSHVWDAYSKAYASRYGTDPVRNAKVNGQIIQLITRVGASDAPAIAAFFVRSNNAYYVKRGHAIGALLSDAEKLATEWRTGRHGTEADAREQDGKQKRGQVWKELIEEARAKDAAGK